MVRESGVYGLRLKRVPATERAGVSITEPSQLLVAGGATAYVAHAVRQLLDSGTCDRILLAVPTRRCADGAAFSVLEAELTATSSTVEVVECDLADPDGLSRLLDRTDPEQPLTVLYGLTGPSGDREPGKERESGPAAESGLDPERSVARLKDSVDGILALHEATRNRPVAAFLLFGSFTAAIGEPGHPEGAALQAFGEALCRHRAAAGLPASLIAWGPDEDGARAAEAPDGGIAGLQLLPLEPRAAVGLLPRLVGGVQHSRVVLDADWRALAARALTSSPYGALFNELPELRPLLADSSGSEGSRRVAADSNETGELLRRLAGLSETEQEEVLLAVICAAAAEVLGHGSVDEIDGGLTFLEIGFSSFTGLELRNMLCTATGLPLPPVMIFDYPSPSSLAGYLRSELEIVGRS